MDFSDEIPICVLHIAERDVPQDAGIIDEDVDGSKGLYRRFDNFFAKLDRVVVCNGLTASLFDLFYDDIGGLGRLAFAFERAPQVIDNDAGSSRAKEEGICFTKTTPATGTTTTLPSNLSSFGDILALFLFLFLFLSLSVNVFISYF